MWDPHQPITPRPHHGCYVPEHSKPWEPPQSTPLARPQTYQSSDPSSFPAQGPCPPSSSSWSPPGLSTCQTCPPGHPSLHCGEAEELPLATTPVHPQLPYWLDWKMGVTTEQQGCGTFSPGFRRVLNDLLLFSFIVALILEVIEAARLAIPIPQGLLGGKTRPETSGHLFSCPPPPPNNPFFLPI